MDTSTRKAASLASSASSSKAARGAVDHVVQRNQVVNFRSNVDAAKGSEFWNAVEKFVAASQWTLRPRSARFKVNHLQFLPSTKFEQLGSFPCKATIRVGLSSTINRNALQRRLFVRIPRKGRANSDLELRVVSYEQLHRCRERDAVIVSQMRVEAPAWQSADTRMAVTVKCKSQTLVYEVCANYRTNVVSLYLLPLVDTVLEVTIASHDIIRPNDISFLRIDNNKLVPTSAMALLPDCTVHIDSSLVEPHAPSSAACSSSTGRRTSSASRRTARSSLKRRSRSSTVDSEYTLTPTRSKAHKVNSSPSSSSTQSTSPPHTPIHMAMFPPAVSPLISALSVAQQQQQRQQTSGAATASAQAALFQQAAWLQYTVLLAQARGVLRPADSQALLHHCSAAMAFASPSLPVASNAMTASSCSASSSSTDVDMEDPSVKEALEALVTIGHPSAPATNAPSSRSMPAASEAMLAAQREKLRHPGMGATHSVAAPVAVNTTDTSLASPTALEILSAAGSGTSDTSPRYPGSVSSQGSAPDVFT